MICSLQNAYKYVVDGNLWIEIHEEKDLEDMIKKSFERKGDIIHMPLKNGDTSFHYP